jgi:hypothetical protein
MMNKPDKRGTQILLTFCKVEYILYNLYRQQKNITQKKLKNALQANFLIVFFTINTFCSKISQKSIILFIKSKVRHD